MQRIDDLTPQQIERMAEFRDKWIAIGLSTEPAVRDKAEADIRLSYRLAGIPEPRKIIWCGSPLSQGITRAVILDKSVRESVGASVGASVWASVGASVWESVGASGYGQHDANWLAFYEYFREVCGLTSQTDKVSGLTSLAKHAGWFLSHQNICWVSERHHILARDERGRLHCVDGPAVAFPDGWAIYAWHGTRVPERVIVDREKVTVHDILGEQNTEVRRVMRNLYGNARFLKDAGAAVIDTCPQHGAKLLSLRLPGDPVDIRMCELTCPSTGEVYYERVPPEIADCASALGWRFNVDGKQYRPIWQT